MLVILGYATGAASETPAPSAGPPEDTGPEADSGGLTLERYLRGLVEADPSWRVRAVEAAIARVREDLSQDRLEVSARATPYGRYDAFVSGAGQPTRHLGALGGTDIAVDVTDDLGGTLGARGSFQRLTKPAYSSGGHQLSANVFYALPLLKNTLGKLYRLEAEAFAADRQAGAEATRAVVTERCAAGIELFVAAYYFQAQAEVWEDLLGHKEKIYARTRRDYQRRMLTRLDFLGAESDWLAAQQRHQGFVAEHRRVWESLAMFLDGGEAEGQTLVAPGETLVALAPPRDTAELYRSLDEHPQVKASETAQAALGVRVRLNDRKADPELSVVPQVGFDYYSRMFQPPGASAPLTDFYGLLALRLELPIVTPGVDAESEILRHRIRQEEFRRAELRLTLTEKARRAWRTLETLEERVKLTAQRAELMSKQIREAEQMLANGRIETQDYLLHWSQYEDVRFQAAELDYLRWRAMAELVRAGGTIPAACQIEEGP